MPVITPLADGTLIAAQHVGESLGSSDNHIEVLRSADGGRTWVNQGGIHPRNPPRDGYTYRGPHIHTVPDGRLAMTAGRFEASDDDLFDADTESLQRPAIDSCSGPPTRAARGRSRRSYRWTSRRTATPATERAACSSWRPTAGCIRSRRGSRAATRARPIRRRARCSSADQGRTWGELTIIADDPTGELLWWDQRSCVLARRPHLHAVLDARVRHLGGPQHPLGDPPRTRARTWSEPRVPPRCAGR